MNAADEIWVPIPGFEGYYEVSDLGRIRGVARRVHHPHSGHVTIKPRIMKQRPLPKTPHRIVTLTRDGKETTMQVHRIVLSAFVGPCPEGMEGCHGDGDPTNNRLSNLRWDTHLENIRDAIKHGTHFNVGAFVAARRAEEASV